MRDEFKGIVHDSELDDGKDNDKDKTEEVVHNPLLKQCKDTTYTEQKPENNNFPVDTGWSWVILFGVTFELMIIAGLFKSAGIIFVAIQERFGSRASMTSMISTVFIASWSVSSLLVMNLGAKFLSSRTITVMGTLATCASYIISSLAQDFELLLFSNGILQGAGSACIQPISLAILGSFFEKHRGLACSIASSRGSFGGLVFAPLLTVMLEYYGFSGTMLLTGAFVFQCLVTAALFRPQAFYTQRVKKIKKNQTYSDTRLDNCLQNESTTRHDTAIIDKRTNEDGAVSQTENSVINGKKRFCFQKIAELFDFTLFRNPVFIVIFFASSFLFVPCVLSMVCIAPHAKDLNTEPGDIAKLLTINSAIDMCSRLVIGYISDRKWIRRSTMIAISAFIVCAVSRFMSFYTTFSWLLFYSVVLGIFAGNFLPYLPPLVWITSHYQNYIVLWDSTF